MINFVFIFITLFRAVSHNVTGNFFLVSNILQISKHNVTTILASGEIGDLLLSSQSPSVHSNHTLTADIGWRAGYLAAQVALGRNYYSC